MGLLDLFRPAPAALLLPRPDEREVFVDAARRAQNAAIEKGIAEGIRAFADSNLYYQTGPIANPNTGLLGTQDALSGTIPVAYRYLTDFMLAQLYADPLCRRICEEAPGWIAAAGHQIDTEDGADQFAELDDRMGVSVAFADAHARANHLRGGGIFIDVDEDGDPDLSEPLDPTKVRRIKRLIPLGGITLQVVYWQADAEGTDDAEVHPLFAPFRGPAQPRYYRLMATMRQGGVSGLIHWTRILYFQGAPVPPDVDGFLACPSTHYALSKLDLCWPSIRRFVTTAANAERIANTHGAWAITVGNKHAADANAQMNQPGASWIDRLVSAFYARKVMVGAPGDAISNVGVPLGGWSEIEQAGYIHVSNQSGIPVPLLFTSLPKGFNADESDWMPQWAGHLAQNFRRWWAQNLIRLYSLEYFRRSGRPPRWMTVNPGPWRQPTEKERMELHKLGAEEIKLLRDSGTITAEEARSRYEPTFTIDFQLSSRKDVLERAEAAAGTDAAPDRRSTLVALAQDPLPDLVERVRAVVPEIEIEAWPHVTLLYLGEVPARSMPAIERILPEHADDWPEELTPVEIGPLGDDGAIVLHLRTGGLGAPQARLLRALAPEIRERQYPAFRPHITIGYARDLTDEQIAALAAIPVPSAIPAGALVLRRDDVDRMRFEAADDAEGFVPPKAALLVVQRALEVRAEKPASQRGMTPVGLARARDLSNGKALSRETVRLMKAYFDRHQSDKSGSTWEDQGKGWQAWMGRGGDAGWRWATRLVERWDREE